MSSQLDFVGSWTAPVVVPTSDPSAVEVQRALRHRIIRGLGIVELALEERPDTSSLLRQAFELGGVKVVVIHSRFSPEDPDAERRLGYEIFADPETKIDLVNAIGNSAFVPRDQISGSKHKAHVPSQYGEWAIRALQYHLAAQ